MLLYHPAFDIHHCVFRTLALLSELPEGDYPIELIQILDFYYVFPELVESIRFPRDGIKYKNLVSKKFRTYEVISDPIKVFRSIEYFQFEAFNSLLSYEFIVSDLFQKGKLQRSSKPIPPKLSRRIEHSFYSDDDLKTLLIKILPQIDFYGKNGLKARTKLMEHRYDPT